MDEPLFDRVWGRYRDDRCLEGPVLSGILGRLDDGFRRETMPANWVRSAKNSYGLHHGVHTRNIIYGPSHSALAPATARISHSDRAANAGRGAENALAPCCSFNP
jgi:hypothetical protein